MNLKVIVLAHRQDTVDRHMKYWEHHGAPITFICPEDKPVQTKHDVLLVGKSAHEGPEAQKRLMKALHVGIFSGAERILIHEHDSICLSPELPPFKRGVFGNVFTNEDRDFLAPYYVNPPWLFDFDSLHKVESAIKKYELTEEGFIDRLIAAGAFVSGIPIRHHEPKGYTEAELNQHRDAYRLLEIIAQGGTMIHGIKDEYMLRRIEKIYDNRHVLRTIGSE